MTTMTITKPSAPPDVPTPISVPGFCGRCDQPAPLLCGGPLRGTRALCHPCRVAESRDRAGLRQQLR